jgi:DNA adenine methylase
MPGSFLKWVGGKARTAGLLAALAPPGTGRLVEPFMGSAAVFFAYLPMRALLADLNEELVACFRAVRDDPAAVMALLEAMPNTPAYFERVRAQSPGGLSDAERAARVVYLNKTAFRGLWRVNRHGAFNVPYGAYDRPLFNRATLLGASAALATAELVAADFEEVLDRVGPGDWVYLDPPYVSAGGYSDFRRYTAGQFRRADHERLAARCRALDRAGIPFLLTNTDNDEARALYHAFDAFVLPTRRDVHLDRRRRASTDLLVANYDVAGRLAALAGPRGVRAATPRPGRSPARASASRP